MSTELPLEILNRRLGRRPGAGPDPNGGLDAEPERDRDGAPGAPDSPDSPDSPNSLVPRWLPDGSAGARWPANWLATVRADPGRAGAVALAITAAIAVLITVFTVIRDRPAPVVSAKLPPVEMVASDSAAPPSPTPTAGVDHPVVVSVVGLVHQPGLATLAPGARVADALSAAGGALDGADTVGLNMARQVADGEQIIVGIAPLPGRRSALGSSVGAGPGLTDNPAGGSTTTAAKPAAPVNLNTATVQQLDALPGVGPVTAAAIVAWRDAHGKFSSVDQLGEVDGIGPARLEKLRALVRV